MRFWCSPRRLPRGATIPVQIRWKSHVSFPFCLGRWPSLIRRSRCFSACSPWPTVWILTMVITRTTLTNPFWPAATLSMLTLQTRIGCRNANTCHRHPRRPYCRQQAPRPTFCARLTIKQTSSLVTFFRRPSSRVLFLGRLQYRSFLDDSNTV